MIIIWFFLVRPASRQAGGMPSIIIRLFENFFSWAFLAVQVENNLIRLKAVRESYLLPVKNLTVLFTPAGKKITQQLSDFENPTDCRAI